MTREEEVRRPTLKSTGSEHKQLEVVCISLSDEKASGISCVREFNPRPDKVMYV